MPGEISHAFPFLGRIAVPLHAESHLVFSLLENFTTASMAHLQKQDHLGELRDVLKCGMHSRYEYVVLQMYFVHVFKNNAHAFGLSTGVDTLSGTTVSSCEELIKSWALLDELGHLRGTYEAERFLLAVLIENGTARDHFLAAFDDPRGREFAQQVLTDEDLWQLHRCIAWLLLEHYRDHKLPSRRTEFNAALDLLHSLVSADEGSQPLNRARGYFRRVRRLAHMYLDTANLPTHVHFHPTVLLQNFAQDPMSFIGEDDQISNRLFGSLLDNLQSNIYSSIEANKYKMERMLGLLEMFRTRIRSRRSPIKSPGSTIAWIFAAKGAKFWGHDASQQSWDHHLRLRFVTDGYFEPQALKLISEETKFRKQTASDRWSLFITSYVSAAGRSCYFDVFEKASSKRAPEGRVITAILNLMKQCHSDMSLWEDFLLAFCGDQVNELIRFMLKRIFSAKYNYRFGREGRFSEFGNAIFITLRGRTKWSRKVAWVTCSPTSLQL